MAQHAKTFAQLRSEAEHAMFGPPDPRISTDAIVNGAIEYLCNLHPWSWLQSLSTLSFVAGQGQILLPEDFGELVHLVGLVAKFTACRRASLRDIVSARIHAPASNLAMLYALGTQAQIAPTAVPRRALEVAPVPAAGLADALSLVYRRRLAVLVNADDVPAIPYGMHELLVHLVRAYAHSRSASQPSHDWELFTQQIPSFIAADGLAGGENQGQLRDAVFDWHDLVGGEAPLMQRIALPGE